MKKFDQCEVFEVPVVLFIFKRTEKSVQIIKEISKIAPRKIYIIGDGPRNLEEEKIVQKCRKSVEKAIDWQCDLFTNYSEINRGVYENIACGAKWVFEREKTAIFLEDDNLPSLSFFQYSKNLLNTYKDEDDILWICGTNYLEEYKTKNNSSFVFTQNLMPCGWASWSHKFLKYYDFDLSLFHDPNHLKKLYKSYTNKILFFQQYRQGRQEFKRKLKGEKYHSWDYHMALSLRYHNKLGISPKVNLIENIGVDVYSIHGGTSFDSEMTRRFCSIKRYDIEFPLIYPNKIRVDKEYEKRVSKIIQRPTINLFKTIIVKITRFIFRLDDDQSIREIFTR